MKNFLKPKGIFISYRRDDVGDLVGRVADALERRFGRKHVFFDKKSIPGGAEWKKQIESALTSCHIALVFIGPNWLRRSDKDQDWVEFEVSRLLSREPKIPCLPVVIGDAKDQLKDLPRSLRDLIERQWFPFRQEPDFFERDVKSLIEQINPTPRTGRLFALGTLAVLLLAGIIYMLLPNEPDVAPSLPSRFVDLHVNSIGMQFLLVDGTDVLFSKYETTVKEYQRFAGSTGTEIYRAEFGIDPLTDSEFEQSTTHPAVMVSWKDAKKFCNWLTKKEHEEGWLTGSQRYRLPTDAEWSIAVGLGDEPEGSPLQKMEESAREIFPWESNEWPPPDHEGNYGGEESRTDDLPKFVPGFTDHHAFLSPVGTYQSIGPGLSDLGGNVWEWCEDRIEEGSPERVLRGGSFRNVTRERFTSTYRNPDLEGERHNNVGFRCVIDLKP